MPTFFPRAVTLRLGVNIKGVVVAGDTCGAGSTASGHIRSFKRVALHDGHLVVSLFASSCPHNTPYHTPCKKIFALDAYFFNK